MLGVRDPRHLALLRHGQYAVPTAICGTATNTAIGTPQLYARIQLRPAGGEGAGHMVNIERLTVSTMS